MVLNTRHVHFVLHTGIASFVCQNEFIFNNDTSKQLVANALPHVAKSQRAHVRTPGQEEERCGLEPREVEDSGVLPCLLP